MKHLLLVFVQHNLVKALPEKAFVKPTLYISMITFIKNFNEFIFLQLLHNDQQGAIRLMSQRHDLLQSKRTEILSNDGCRFHDEYTLDGYFLFLRVFLIGSFALFQEMVNVSKSTFMSA